MLGQALEKMVWNHRICAHAQGFRAALPGQVLECLIPANDTAVNVLDQNAHVDRFDNVFAEVLQVVILGGFLFQ